MDNLYDKLNSMEEETTSGDIAYAPAMGFVSNPAVINIKAKDKKNKKKILKEDFDRKYDILKNNILNEFKKFEYNNNLSYLLFY